MSMICNVRRVRPDELDRLLRSPDQIVAFLYGPEAAAARPQGFLARLFGSRPAPVAPIAWTPRSEANEIDIEKAWHGLHFLFTGTAWEGDEPAGYLVTGGRPIGSVDAGYGPARALEPDDVGELARYLTSLSEADLEQRYDPERMTSLKIYPEIWGDDGEEEALEYLVEGFRQLRDFVAEARDAGDGLVIYLN